MKSFLRAPSSALPAPLLAVRPVAIATPAASACTPFDDTQAGCMHSPDDGRRDPLAPSADLCGAVR